VIRFVFCGSKKIKNLTGCVHVWFLVLTLSFLFVTFSFLKEKVRSSFGSGGPADFSVGAMIALLFWICLAYNFVIYRKLVFSILDKYQTALI